MAAIRAARRPEPAVLQLRGDRAPVEARGDGLGDRHVGRRRSWDGSVLDLRGRADQRLPVERPAGAYKKGDPLGTGRHLWRRTLKLNFWRPGDEQTWTESQIRFGIPGEPAHVWTYCDAEFPRTTAAAPAAAPAGPTPEAQQLATRCGRPIPLDWVVNYHCCGRLASLFTTNPRFQPPLRPGHVDYRPAGGTNKGPPRSSLPQVRGVATR